MKKIYGIVYGKYKKIKNPEIYILGKKQSFLLFAVSGVVKMKRYLKKKNQLKY